MGTSGPTAPHHRSRRAYRVRRAIPERTAYRRTNAPALCPSSTAHRSKRWRSRRRRRAADSVERESSSRVAHRRALLDTIGALSSPLPLRPTADSANGDGVGFVGSVASCGHDLPRHPRGGHSGSLSLRRASLRCRWDVVILPCDCACPCSSDTRCCGRRRSPGPPLVEVRCGHSRRAVRAERGQAVSQYNADLDRWDLVRSRRAVTALVAHWLAAQHLRCGGVVWPSSRPRYPQIGIPLGRRDVHWFDSWASAPFTS